MHSTGECEVVLPDTSVWIDFSRSGSRGQAAGLRALLDSGEVATCGPVAAELLAGVEGEIAERMWETLASLSWADLSPLDWREVGATANRLRGTGQTLPLTDLVIAVTAARSGYPLWSFDSDFERIRPVLGDLVLYELPA